MAGWNVSLAKRDIMIVKMPKKIIVHCVHRQPLRFTIKLPMTGLEIISAKDDRVKVKSSNSPEARSEKRSQNKNRGRKGTLDGFESFVDGAASNSQRWGKAEPCQKTQNTNTYKSMTESNSQSK
jgi:hypothetical protein